MKEVAGYRQEDGQYDDDQVILDAFDGDREQYEAFLSKRLDNRMQGGPGPELPEPYEALYQQVYALQLDWVGNHLPELRRKQKEMYGVDPIVAVSDDRWCELSGENA